LKVFESRISAFLPFFLMDFMDFAISGFGASLGAGDRFPACACKAGRTHGNVRRLVFEPYS